jgi:hypothetical protein
VTGVFPASMVLYVDCSHRRFHRPPPLFNLTRSRLTVTRLTALRESVASRVQRAAQTIITRTDGSNFWFQTRSLRNPVAAWRGRHGRVYRVRDARLGRDVAIKVLPDTLARDTDRLRGFEHALVLTSGWIGERLRLRSHENDYQVRQ